MLSAQTNANNYTNIAHTLRGNEARIIRARSTPRLLYAYYLLKRELRWYAAQGLLTPQHAARINTQIAQVHTNRTLEPVPVTTPLSNEQ